MRLISLRGKRFFWGAVVIIVFFGALILPQTVKANYCGEDANGNTLKKCAYPNGRETSDYIGGPLECTDEQILEWGEATAGDDPYCRYKAGRCVETETCSTLPEGTAGCDPWENAVWHPIQEDPPGIIIPPEFPKSVLPVPISCSFPPEFGNIHPDGTIEPEIPYQRYCEIEALNRGLGYGICQDIQYFSSITTQLRCCYNSQPPPPPPPPPCPIPEVPTELTCNTAGNKISWNPVEGIANYPVWIDDLSNGWVGNCDARQNSGDFCFNANIVDDFLSPSKDFTFTPERNYKIQVYAENECGQSPPAEIFCPDPSPDIPTPTMCQVTTSPAERPLFPESEAFNISANVTSGLGTGRITKMRFGSYGGNIASVPAPTAPDTDYTDTEFPYNAPVTANAYGATAIWATADVDDNGDGIVDRRCPASGTTDTDIYVPHAISVKVFNDDGDGVQERGEIGTAGAKVMLTPGNQYGFTIPTTQTFRDGSSDTAYFWRIPGNYTLTVTVPSGYTIRNSGSQVASIIINNLSQNMTYSFPVVPPLPGSGTPTPTPSFSADCSWDENDGKPCKTADGWGICNWNSNNCDIPLYSISGKLFLDNYEDTQSTGDDKYTNSVAVTVKKGEETFAVTPSGGTYTADNLPAGDYTIKFSGLPTEYRFTYPNTPDNSLQVQVGPTCEYPITTSEASCRP